MREKEREGERARDIGRDIWRKNMREREREREKVSHVYNAHFRLSHSLFFHSFASKKAIFLLDVVLKFCRPRK